MVDEGAELADCRMVDLDATTKDSALPLTVYLAEFDEDDSDIRHFLNLANKFPVRWVAKETT